MTERNRIVLIFDEHYSQNGQVVFAAARQLMREVDPSTEFRIVCRARYRGPRFDRPFGKVQVFGRNRRPFRQEAGWRERLRRRLAWTHLLDARHTWISNVEPGDERLLHQLFDADRLHAVVVFTVDAEFALQVARLTHIYSSTETPHILVVTPQEKAEAATVRDLRWLRAKVLWDGNAVANVPAAANSSTGPSRRMWLPGPDRFGDRPVGGMLVPMAFETPSPLSFMDATYYPYQLNVDNSVVSWSDWIGPQCRLPQRVRDVVLFLRPDWMSCGSATLFESLAGHFRGKDALLIDIGIWPYYQPFDGQERAQKVSEQQQHIRSALYFSSRRTNNLLHALRQLIHVFAFPPTRVSNQVLLQNATAAMPSLAVEAVRRAKINLIYLNHYFTYLFARDLIGDRPFYLDTHDLQSINFVHNGAINMITRRADQYHQLLAQELRVLQRAERLGFVNTAELEIAARYLPREKLDFIIPLPSIRRCPPRSMGAVPRMLIIASRNAANERNLVWFLNQVWPRILEWQLAGAEHANVPALQLDICGSINIAMKSTNQRWVKFHGQVEELRTHYEQADLVLLPVITGGGVAVKTVEALLYGRPVVATRHALRGLPENIVQAVGYSNDPEEFAQTVLALLDSTELRREYAERSWRAATLLRQENFYERLTRAMDRLRSVSGHGADRERLPVATQDQRAMADAVMVRNKQLQPQTLAE